MIKQVLQKIKWEDFCPKCKRESLIEAKNMKIIVINEPDIFVSEKRNYAN